MAQAQETILKINGSLKEYKQTLDAIKASMLGLSKDTDEYKKAANQAAAMQEKLNQVMYDAKHGGDEATNTMAALKEELRELKKEANNTDMGSAKFQELTVRIKETNDKLKEAEAKMGIFNRNVGDYSNQIVDAFGKMGISIGGLEKGFALASNGTKGFKTALDVIAKHPFIAVATILVGALIKIKDAIGQNEQLSKKWSVAMSAFQPILDAITKGIDWLASKLVDVVVWVTNSIPKVLTKVGGFAKSVTNIIGKIADVVLWLPKQIVNGWTQVQKTLVDGIAWIMNKAADAMALIGMDEQAAKFRSFTATVQNTTKSALDTINSYVQNGTNFIRKIGDGIDSTTKKWANSMQSRMDFQKQVNKLEEDTRNRQKEAAESELKQNELRNKIAAASGEERLKLLGELRTEIQKNAKAEEDLAKRQLELQKQRNSFTPNSKADNEYTAQLEANIIRVQAAREAAQTKLIKQEESTATALKNADTKASKEALAEIDKAEKERIKQSADFVKEYNTQLEKIKLDGGKELTDVKGEEEQLKSMGLLTPQQLIEYENKKYSIMKDGYDKEIALTNTALENEKLTEDDKLKLANRLTQLLIEADNAKTQHIITNNKLELDNVKFTNAEKLKAQEEYEESIKRSQDARFVELAQSYVDGKISYEQYNKDLFNLTVETEMEQLQQEAENAKAREGIAREYWEQIKAIYGDGSKEAQDALEALNKAHNKVIETEGKVTVATAEQKKKQKDETIKSTQAQISKYSNLANSVVSLGNTIASTMQANIKAKLEEGKISQEEAEKEFERTKKVQVAMATISMLAGVAQAISGAMELGPILGPILGAINAATVIASGVAQIREIKKQKLDSGGETTANVSAASTPTAPSVNDNLSMVSVNPLLNEELDSNSLQSMQTQNSYENNNKDVKVYVVEEDIREVANKVNVRENNTDF